MRETPSRPELGRRSLPGMQIELSELELRYAALRVGDPGRTARMRASLAADGQQSPVSVVANSDAERHRFVLIDGYLRVSAARALAHDALDAVVLPLAEADALIMTHRLEEIGRRSALEDGWLLEELSNRHGLSQLELGKRLSRSRSWVCRRLALVHLVPEIAQAAVRDGFVPAQAAMKYLVPLSRDKRDACERIVQHLDFAHEPAVTEREVGRLYLHWRLGDIEQRTRIETQPRLFPRVEAASQPDAKSDTHRLVGDFNAISGLCMRARRLITDGKVDLGHRGLRRAFREAQRGFV
ncbi:MAG TPA: ParB/RepB/Spo0J family partition protein, partial [Polyangiales bacterium]|nr:ParB/RepB/Spo0J family partition protein [Polyangiales bacterium]